MTDKVMLPDGYDVDAIEANRPDIQHPRGSPGIDTPKEILFRQ